MKHMREFIRLCSTCSFSSQVFANPGRTVFRELTSSGCGWRKERLGKTVAKRKAKCMLRRRNSQLRIVPSYIWSDRMHFQLPRKDFSSNISWESPVHLSWNREAVYSDFIRLQVGEIGRESLLPSMAGSNCHAVSKFY